jgi:hypothetical protein
VISFDQAKNLKKGDVVFSGPYTGYVVKTKVNKKAQTVAITYTDGSSDEFEGTNANLSLTRPEDPASQKPSAKPAPKAAAPKKIYPEFAALPNATDPLMERLKAGVDRNAQWRSLDWFEADRVKIAQAISTKLGIPLHEFEDTPQTASFHFMSLALSIAKWLHKSGWDAIEMRDHRSMNQFEELARTKAMAGILVRLFGHPYVQNIGQMEGLGSMMKVFTEASGVSETMLGHILTAHSYVRQSTILMGQFMAAGSEGGYPVTMPFFEPYEEFLENDPDLFMPSDAVMDASIQLYSTLKFISEQPGLPASMATLPDDETHAHNFLRNYLMMSGLYRTPATLQLGKLSFSGASLGAALDSLTDEKPLVLLDSVFQDGDSVEIVVPFNPMSKSSDSQSLAGFLRDEGKKLPKEPTIAVAMYPMI